MRCLIVIPTNARWIGVLDSGRDEVRSTEWAIISSYPTSVGGIIVLLNMKHLIFTRLRYQMSIRVDIANVYYY